MNMISTPTQASVPAGNPFKVSNISGGEARMDLAAQWIARPHDERFTNLSDMRQHLHHRSTETFETRLPTRGIEIFAPAPKETADTKKLFLGLPGGREVSPTHWSFGQIASLAKAPAGYLRSLPSQIASDALNYGLRFQRDVEEVKLYGRDRLDLRAATGPSYGRIHDYEIIEAVQQIAGEGTGDMRWKVPGVMDWRTMIYDPNVPVTKDTTTLFASDRDMFIFLVDDRNPISIGKLPNGDDDLMFRGFYIQNSEVGAKALKIAAFYLRPICCNRIMWGVEHFEEISIRHTSLAPSRFIDEAQPALKGFAEGHTTRLLEGVEKAKSAQLASDEGEALDFLTNRGFSRKKALEILSDGERDEGRPVRSAWDFSMAITAAARAVPYQDERIAIELEAQRILDKVA